MKAKFASTGIIKIVFGFVFALDVIFITVFLCGIKLYGIIALILTACVVSLNSLHGYVSAGEKEVIIVFTLFGKAVKKKILEYGEIESTECIVETELYGRGGGIIYKMVLTVKKKDGTEMELLKKLNIESGFPAEQPDKYKQYLAEQPLMKISHYIYNKLHLNTSA